MVDQIDQAVVHYWILRDVQEPMASLMRSELWCRNLMTKLIKAIGMTPIVGSEVSIGFNDPVHPERNGISGTMMMVESHVAVHTWPRTIDGSGAAWVLVASCRPFDITDVVLFLRNAFGDCSIKIM